LEETDDVTMSARTAGNEEAFLPLEERALVADPRNPREDTMILSFFPTAEGYYDYENFRYIYQYKDHLGNVRVSFVKNSAGDLQVMDTNDYYPFGLSFMKPIRGISVFDPMAIPYNYKYNGKELQETGMYDYGARFYMPDIGRWGVVDPLAHKMPFASPYNYCLNNPINMIDPDGRIPYQLQLGGLHHLVLLGLAFTVMVVDILQEMFLQEFTKKLILIQIKLR
jgi:RHS repeat-associated protein